MTTLTNFFGSLLLFYFTLNISFAQNTLQQSTSDNKLIHFESRLNNTHYFTKDTNYIYLYLEVLTDSTAPVKSKTPLNISLVLDRSGSMSGAKLRYAKEASKFMIDNLNKTDNISLIAYDHQIQIVSASGSAKRKKKLKKQIDDIYHAGSTNLSGGMLQGFKEVRSTFKEGYVNRVLLLSDGLANKGITDFYKLQDTVQSVNRKYNITLSTVGLGADFDEDMMENLAEYGGANYYFVEKARKITEIFQQELESLQSVVGQQMELQIKMPTDAIELREVFGYPYVVDSNQLVIIPFNDIFAAEKKAVLLKFAKKQKNLSKPLTFKAHLSYKDVTKQMNTILLENEQQIMPSEDSSVLKMQVDTVVQRQILLAKANMQLQAAIKEVDKGNFAGARSIIKETQGFLDQAFKKIEPDSLLHKQYEHNIAYHKEIDKFSSYKEYQRKLAQKFAKSNNYKLRKKK